MVPKAARKAASHVGGVKYAGGLDPPKPENPRWCDASNHSYHMLFEYLRELYTNTRRDWPDWDVPPHLRNGKEVFFTKAEEGTCADVIVCVLAAGDAALALQDYRDGKSHTYAREWHQIRGSGCARGDRVTPFIDNWLLHFRRYGCSCTVCQERGQAGRAKYPSGALSPFSAGTSRSSHFSTQ